MQIISGHREGCCFNIQYIDGTEACARSCAENPLSILASWLSPGRVGGFRSPCKVWCRENAWKFTFPCGVLPTYYGPPLSLPVSPQAQPLAFRYRGSDAPHNRARSRRFGGCRGFQPLTACGPPQVRYAINTCLSSCLIQEWAARWCFWRHVADLMASRSRDLTDAMNDQQRALATGDLPSALLWQILFLRYF